MQGKKTFLIIDSNSVIHRAFHALPSLSTKSGQLTNAVYGFLLVFLRAITDFRPDFVAAAFDLPFPTFRHKKYKEYKAQRPKAPRELTSQIPLVKDILKVFGVPVFEKEGFEADDIISTLALKAKKADPEIETVILSGDSDNLQLVDANTKAYLLRKGVKDIILYDKERVKEKFQGLSPGQLIDFKALRGDNSDNIPGVPGIGDKTAISLLLNFGTLEKIYKEIENEKDISQKVKASLLANKEKAFLSRDLVRLDKRVPVIFNLEKCRFGGYDREKVKETFAAFEFHTLVKRINNIDASKSGIRNTIEQGKLFP